MGILHDNHLAIREMFSTPTSDQVRSLAGIYQAASLVHQLATQDAHSETALRDSASSILRLDANSVEEVFGPNEPYLGCQLVRQMLGVHSGSRTRLLRVYVFGMNYHAAQIPGKMHIMEIIHSRLEELKQEFPEDGEWDTEDEDRTEYLYQSLAELYTRSISILKPRIVVHGNQNRLSNPLIANRVRTALFAGIRAAFLWHQLGGKQWHLWLFRRQYQLLATQLTDR